MDLITELEKLKREMTEASFKGKPADVILFLASETLDALNRGSSCPGYERHKIIGGCVPKADVEKVDPKAWMPHVDKLKRVLAAQSSSIELIYKEGGGRGNASKYSLQLVEESIEEVAPSESRDEYSASPISYCRSSASEVTPLFFVRPFFKKDLKNNSFRGALFLFGFVMTGAFIFAAWPLLYLISILYAPDAIELKQVLILAFSGAIFWFVWKQVYEPIFRLVDERVVKAPEWIAGLMEDPCELEMYRQDDGQWTRLVRFKAECSLCGGDVLLRSGKPDHAYPLVGRCLNSPNAHVYSFDRMLMRGAYIGPPVG